MKKDESTLKDYYKRKIGELNLIDDLLFTIMATDENYAVPCLKVILSVLLEKEIKDIIVHGQKILPGDDTDLRGVRLDVEVTESEDGLTFLYFNTKGTLGGSEAIKNMLLYIQDSRKENAVDESTTEVADYVDSVVKSKRMEDTVMTFGYRLDQERREGIAEGRVEGRAEGRAEGRVEGTKEATIIDIGKSIVMLKQFNISKADALDSLNKQYPDHYDVIISKIDEIYK